MAEFIALLLSTLAGLLGQGLTDAGLSARVQSAIEAHPPVPMAELEVSCQGAALNSMQQISFDTHEIFLEPLLVDRAVIEASGIKLGADGRLSMEGIQWTAWINEQQLTTALRGHVDKLSDATVSIDAAGITLRGTYPMLLGLRIPYEVTGELTVEQQTKLMFHITRSGVSGVPVPAKLNALIEKEINPVYDLAQFAKRSKKDLEAAKKLLDYAFELHVAELKPQQDLIIVSGSA